jgi:hypothetical protein
MMGPVEGMRDGAKERAYCRDCGNVDVDREIEVNLAFWNSR